MAPTGWRPTGERQKLCPAGAAHVAAAPSESPRSFLHPIRLADARSDVSKTTRD